MIYCQNMDLYSQVLVAQSCPTFLQPHGLLWWLRWYSVYLQGGRPRFNPWVGKIPCRRKWQPTLVLLPGQSHGWRGLVGYSPWGHKELDTTEQLQFHSSLSVVDCSLPGSSEMEFPRQEYWSGLPFPSPGIFPNPGIEPGSPAVWVDSLLPELPGSPS